MATKKPVPIQRSRKYAPSPKSDGRVVQDVSAPRVPSEAPVQLLLTSKQAAYALAINRSTLYLLLMRGEICSIKIGRLRRIPVTALEKWIEQQIAA